MLGCVRTEILCDDDRIVEIYHVDKQAIETVMEVGLGLETYFGERRFLCIMICGIPPI